MQKVLFMFNDEIENNKSIEELIEEYEEQNDALEKILDEIVFQEEISIFKQVNKK